MKVTLDGTTFGEAHTLELSNTGGVSVDGSVVGGVMSLDVGPRISVFPAGLFIPATTGTFPDNYAQTGIAFDDATDEKAAMPLLVPTSYGTNPTVSVVIVGATLQSGTVRWRLGPEEGDNDVVVTLVGGSYVGPLDFPTPMTWYPQTTGALAGYQFSQFPLSRIGTNDSLADDAAVLLVVVSPEA